MHEKRLTLQNIVKVEEFVLVIKLIKCIILLLVA